MASTPTKDDIDKTEGYVHTAVVTDVEGGDAGPTRPLRRGLHKRHIAFVGFGGGIGVGIFVGVGASLARAGPLGVWLAYCFTALNVWCIIQSCGEMATMFPVAGTFPHYVNRFLDPAFGFALGWTYWFDKALAVATEAVASVVLIQYWTDRIPAGALITALLAVMWVINFLPVRFFGEAEVITASIKVITLAGLIILGLVIDLGGAPSKDRLGFRYWKDPGAMNNFPGIGGSWGRFLSFFLCTAQAAFAYGGSEVIVMTAAEATNPHRQVPRSIRMFVVRLLFFYVAGVFIIGLIVPFNDPGLVSGAGNANSSPWVIAIKAAGIKGLPSVVNAAILTSAWSAGNTYLYIAARSLVGLALDGQAPKILAKTTANGVPIPAVILSAVVSCFAYLSLGAGGASQAFGWLLSMNTLFILINWGVLCLTYIRFRAARIAQAVSPADIPWKSWAQPYAAYYGMCFCWLVVFVQGFPVFVKGGWNGATFVASYISLVIFVVPCIGYKIIKRTKFVRASEADVVSGRLDPADVQDDPEPTTWWGKALDKII
ncbi:hypothetical protein Q8F55_003258 [Vanrija albida]|uniref:Amino acid permease/ SLC12A domain-containing protein n=1 Tax=Vanrija albida TaxID=181172 RepID=A0ABR3QCL2_9TREE